MDIVNELNNIEIKGKRIVINGETYIVLKRKNELDTKPPYYLFNTNKKEYLSSLYETNEKNTYLFDIRNDGEYIIRFYQEGYEIEEI